MNRKHFAVIKKSVLVILLVFIAGCMAMPASKTLKVTDSNIYLEHIEVEILGEVNKPGIYTLAKKSTLHDLVNMAEGLTDDADVSYLNMNQKLSNHDVIVIEETREQVRISINAGSIEQLIMIPGIGPKTAQAIIDYREMNGLFQSIEELDHVKGIGTKKLEKMKDFIKL